MLILLKNNANEQNKKEQIHHVTTVTVSRDDRHGIA